MKSKELLLHFCARSYVNQRLNSTPSNKFSLRAELKQLAGTAQTKATSAPTRRRVQAGCVCQRPGVSAARGSISRTVFCRTAKDSRHLRFIHVYRIYHRVVRDPSTRGGAARLAATSASGSTCRGARPRAGRSRQPKAARMRRTAIWRNRRRATCTGSSACTLTGSAHAVRASARAIPPAFPLVPLP
eukprot:COSAG06_NODE_24214_length_669_cov_1.050877_1_plen_187_part_00